MPFVTESLLSMTLHYTDCFFVPKINIEQNFYFGAGMILDDGFWTNDFPKHNLTLH